MMKKGIMLRQTWIILININSLLDWMNEMNNDSNDGPYNDSKKS